MIFEESLRTGPTAKDTTMTIKLKYEFQRRHDLLTINNRKYAGLEEKFLVLGSRNRKVNIIFFKNYFLEIR